MVIKFLFFFIKCHYKIYVYCIKAQKWTNFHFFLISKCKSIINGLFINENTRVMKKSYISFKKKIFWYLYTIFEIFTKFLMYKMFFLLNSFNIEQIMALWIMKKIRWFFSKINNFEAVFLHTGPLYVQSLRIFGLITVSTYRSQGLKCQVSYRLLCITYYYF